MAAIESSEARVEHRPQAGSEDDERPELSYRMVGVGALLILWGVGGTALSLLFIAFVIATVGTELGDESFLRNQWNVVSSLVLAAGHAGLVVVGVGLLRRSPGVRRRGYLTAAVLAPPTIVEICLSLGVDAPEMMADAAGEPVLVAIAITTIATVLLVPTAVPLVMVIFLSTRHVKEQLGEAAPPPSEPSGSEETRP